MPSPAEVRVPGAAARRLDRKLASIAAGRYTPDDFVIADAKDADMASGLACAGPVTSGLAGPGRYRTRAEYLDAMRVLAAQGELDIMLTSASNGERLAGLAVASAAACVRSPSTSGGIKTAEACLAEADRAGYRPHPPVHPAI